MFKQNVKATLRSYETEDTVRVNREPGEESKNAFEIKNLCDIWDGKSPYKYYIEKQEDYQRVEPDIFERPPEFLREPHKQRWNDLNQFWF